MKGFSPLVATVLLIAIVLAIGLSVLTWQQDLIDNFSKGFAQSTAMKLACNRGSVFIENATFKCAAVAGAAACNINVDHTMNLTVRNTGGVDLKIIKAYVKNTTGSIFGVDFDQEAIIDSKLQFVNISRDYSCWGIAAADVLLLTTDCPNVVGSFPGADIQFVNC